VGGEEGVDGVAAWSVGVVEVPVLSVVNAGSLLARGSLFGNPPFLNFIRGT